MTATHLPKCMPPALTATALLVTAALSACIAIAAPKADPPVELHYIWEFVFDPETGAETGSRYGYIDGTGRVVIPLQFGEAYDFSDGLARVWADDGWAYIDTTGRIAFRLPEDVPVVGDFYDGMAWFNQGAHVEHHMIEGGKWGYVDRTGRVAIPPRFVSDYDHRMPDFSDGLVAVPEGDDMRVEDVREDDFEEDIEEDIEDEEDEDVAEGDDVQRAAKWGYINKAGELVIGHRFDKAGPFHDGLAPVRVGDKKGYIDRSGRMVIRLRHNWDFAEYSDFSDGMAAVSVTESGRVTDDGRRCDHCGKSLKGATFGGNCPHCEFEIYPATAEGYIDRSGKLVIAPQLSETWPFTDGLAAVKVGNNYETARWGFIDKQGRWAVKPDLLEVRQSFRGGVARVVIGRSPGDKSRHEALIDTSGKVLW